MFKTHLLISLLLGLLTYQFFPINKFLFITIVLISGVLPDVDLQKSKLGKRIRPISDIINFIFGHRGIFHSIFVLLFLFLVFYSFGLTYYGIALLIGYLGHLLADSFSKEGINFLNPISRFRIRGFMRVGGMLEYIIFIIIFILVIFETIKLL
jgi:inner membrane protein